MSDPILEARRIRDVALERARQFVRTLVADGEDATALELGLTLLERRGPECADWWQANGRRGPLVLLNLAIEEFQEVMPALRVLDGELDWRDFPSETYRYWRMLILGGAARVTPEQWQQLDQWHKLVHRGERAKQEAVREARRALARLEARPARDWIMQADGLVGPYGLRVPVAEGCEVCGRPTAGFVPAGMSASEVGICRGSCEKGGADRKETR